MIKSFLPLTFASILLLGSVSAAEQAALPEPNWGLATAREAVAGVDSKEALKTLFRLAREGNETQLMQELSAIEHRSDWPAPAREYVLHEFASALGDLQPWTVSVDVIDYLAGYRAQTLVPHDDRASVGIPLFNIRSAAEGSANNWRRKSATPRAKLLFDAGAQAWVNGYLAAPPAERMGFVDALESANRQQLLAVGQASLQRIPENPALTAVATRAALLATDPVMFQQAVSSGRGAGLAPALKAASTTFDDAETLAIVDHAIRQAPPANAALAIALLAPARLDQADMTELMFVTLDNQKLGSAASLVLSASKYPEIHQRLALVAGEKDSLASKRAALAISNARADLAGDPR